MVLEKFPNPLYIHFPYLLNIIICFLPFSPSEAPLSAFLTHLVIGFRETVNTKGLWNLKNTEGCIIFVIIYGETVALSVQIHPTS